MFLDKALKKQKRYKKLFLIIMVSLGLFLPVFAYLANVTSALMLWYLIVLEMLIMVAIINKINFYKLEFLCSNNRLRVKSGIFTKVTLIFCNKVSIVHTNKCGEDMEIVIVTAASFKNKTLKPITKGFMKKYPEASEQYLRLKKMNPETIFYFQTVKRGSLDKYILLESIYKNCVNAVYTTAAIENIKIARMQNELK